MQDLGGIKSAADLKGGSKKLKASGKIHIINQRRRKISPTPLFMQIPSAREQG